MIIYILLFIFMYLLININILNESFNFKNKTCHYPVSMNFIDGDKRILNLNITKDKKISSKKFKLLFEKIKKIKLYNSENLNIQSHNKEDINLIKKYYDFTTLFYNIFLDYNNENLVFIGPNLLNLKNKYMNLSVIFNGLKIKNTYEKHNTYYFCLKYNVKNIVENNNVEIYLHDYKKKLIIKKNKYKCRNRILITKQKNNRSRWIVDWVKHYTNKYNVTNIIIFDNNSSNFNSIKKKLSQFKHVKLIPYNFPFGIPSVFSTEFLQYSLLEIALQQFCKDDAYIFNFDIDELLVVDPNYLNKIFQKKNVYYQIKSWWVPMTVDKNLDYSFKDFKFKNKEIRDKGGFKYIVNKQICKKMDVHSCNVKIETNKILDENYFLHFKGISTSWNYERLNKTTNNNFIPIDKF